VANIKHEPHTILVTGGCGFIGSHFIRHMLSSDTACRLLNIDTLTYAGSQDNVVDITQEFKARYQFIHGDICDGQLMSRLFADHQPNTIVHLAAESHVDRSITGSDPFLHSNVIGTHVLLQCALASWRERRDVRFHHVSTDEVFGSLPAQGYFTETSPYNPSNPYSASKAASDHLVRAWAKTYDLPVTLSYGTNTYGSHQYPEN